MSALERVERNMFKCLGHVKIMGEKRLAKRMYRVNLDGNRGRGRPQRRWRDEGKSY